MWDRFIDRPDESHSGHAHLCGLGCSLLGISAASNSAINATSSVIKLTAIIVVLPSTSRIKWISRL